MALQLAVWLPATATSSILLVRRKFRESLGINITHLLLTALGLYWAIKRNSLFDGVALSSLLAFSLYSFGIAWFASLSDVNMTILLNALFRTTAKPMLSFLGLQYVLWIVSPLVSSIAWLVLLPFIWYYIGKRVQREIHLL